MVNILQIDPSVNYPWREKMILINGQESNLQVQHFANLEEMIIASFENCAQAQQIITDVLLNDEPFSEIYPHQAEDIAASQVNKLEIHSVNMNTMAVDVINELFKVTHSMEVGAAQVSNAFRQGDEADALEVLQDLINVNRDFLNVFATLRTDFGIPSDQSLDNLSERYSELLSELIEVMESEDWILLADLLEFEISPIYIEWNTSLNFIKAHFLYTEPNTITQ